MQLTHWLSNTILDPDSKIIDKNAPGGATGGDKINKEVYREIQSKVADMLKDFSFDGYDWLVGQVDPESQAVEVTGDRYPPHFTDHEDLRAYCGKKLSKKNRQQFVGPENKMFKESKYFNSHVDVRNHMMIFQRCFAKDCKPCLEHHKKNPIPEDFYTKMNLPTRERNGALFFVPELDETNPGHFKTYLQMCLEMTANPNRKYAPDSEQPDGPHSRCPEKGCLISFKSGAAADRHANLYHDKVDAAPAKDGKGGKPKTCSVCKAQFPTLWYLTKHKKAEGHFDANQKRGRPKKK